MRAAGALFMCVASLVISRAVAVKELNNEEVAKAMLSGEGGITRVMDSNGNPGYVFIKSDKAARSSLLNNMNDMLQADIAVRARAAGARRGVRGEEGRRRRWLEAGAGTHCPGQARQRRREDDRQHRLGNLRECLVEEDWACRHAQ